MRRSRACHLFAACSLLALIGPPAHAQVASPVQSKALPSATRFGPVYASGSDAASREFNLDALPRLLALADLRLAESSVLANADALAVDPSKLTLRTDADVRVYFVAEGAGYRNTLGATLASGSSTTQALVFPDASSPTSYLGGSSVVRTATAPLVAGDFVQLGRLTAGTLLDFFLTADGANGGKTTYGSTAAKNPDRLTHVVAFGMPDSPFLMLAFEDLLGGGDRDYNDVIVAVDIGRKNVAVLRGPEPSLPAALAMVALVGGFARRRKGAGQWEA